MKELSFNAFRRIILIFIVFAVLLVSVSSTAFAYATAEYSDVLYDLSLDDEFVAKKDELYKADDEDFSIELINVAESADNRLLIYTHHPAGEKVFLPAKYIRMQMEEGVNDYSLTLISQNGRFAKYIVNDFIVSEEVERVYKIVALLREFNQEYDENAYIDQDQTIACVSFPVGKQYYFSQDENLESINKCFDLAVIQVTDKFLGHVRYPGGFPPFVFSSCDSFFLAFDTDLPIERLTRATIRYTHRYYYETLYGNPNDIFPDSVQVSVSGPLLAEKILTEEQKGSFDGGLFFPEYTWKRIETVSDFLKTPELEFTDSEKQILSSKKWVLRFCEEDVFQYWEGAYLLTHCSLISDVSLFELEFLLNGQTYNLGVVDNYQTGSRNAFGHYSLTNKYLLMIVFFAILLAFLVIVIFLFPKIILKFFSFVLDAILFVIKWFFIILWWIIRALFKWIFGKNNHKGNGKGGGK